MENKLDNISSSWFPNYFKKLGIVVIILTFIILIVLKLKDAEILKSQYNILETLALNAIILGLFLIAWAREKVEDEMITHIRYLASAWSIGFIVIMVIIKPLVDYMLNDPQENYTGQQFAMALMISYLTVFYWMKKRS